MSLRFLKRTAVLAVFSMIVLLAVARPVSASVGTIDPGSTGDDTAQFENASYGAVNFKPTLGTPITVTDTAITGNAWGDYVGWINMNPINGGVTNTCNGDLGGYAWGENTGWINFAPTLGGVSISPTTGEFSGNAWSENMGWIEFSCPGVGCVRTDWSGCTTPPAGGGSSSGGVSTAPACSINAAPATVSGGNSTALSWNTNIGVLTSATIYSTATGNTAYPTTTNGSVFATPPLTTTYIATFSGTFPSGTATCSVTVTVDDLIVPPPIDPILPVDPVLPVDPTLPIDPTTIPDPGAPGMPDIPTLPNNQPLPLPGDEFACTGDDCVTNAPLFNFNISPSLVSSDALRAVAIAALVLTAITNLPGMIFRLQNLFLAWLGFKKRRRSWGVVYDSHTKQPLDPAYVVLSDVQGNEVASSITDLDGRYGFLVPPGIYRINAGKTNYQFPSVMLAGRQKDELYDNLYFGGEIEIKRDDEVITRNIPMDPIGTDWNEVAKREQKRFGFFKRADIWFHKIVNVFFWLGFGIALFATVIAPAPFNFVILGLYAFMFILTLTGFSGKKYGGVRNRNGDPLAFAIIRIFNAELHREIAHKVTTPNGKYYAIIPKGRYYVTIENKNLDGTYTKVYTSEVMDINHGILKKDFKTL